MPTTKPIRPANKKPSSRKTATGLSPVGRFWRLRRYIDQHYKLVIVVLLFAAAGTAYLSYSMAATLPVGSIYVAANGRCLDNKRDYAANSNPVQIYSCNGGAGQRWDVRSDGTLRVQGYCLDVKRAGTAPSTPVQIYTCNGGLNQKWTRRGAAFVNVNSNLCLDNKRNVNANSNPVQIYTCNGGGNQQWGVVGASSSGVTGSVTGGGSTSSSTGLDNPSKKEIAMQLVSSAENSSLNWKAQYAYIEDIGDGRGYTGGIVGFCSGCGDMYNVVNYYNQIRPNNVLTKYTATLKKYGDSESASHTGLGTAFVNDWKTAAKDSSFQKAQNDERDRVYFNPAVSQGKADKIRTLGQFMYYDALVMHGPGNDSASFGGIRAAALKKAKTPAQGGDERTYLNAFLDARKAAMLKEAAHSETSRVDTEQRVFLNNGNFDLNVPLSWRTYGDSYSITRAP